MTLANFLGEGPGVLGAGGALTGPTRPGWADRPPQVGVLAGLQQAGKGKVTGAPRVRTDRLRSREAHGKECVTVFVPIGHGILELLGRILYIA